jgi:hypothetical protein
MMMASCLDLSLEEESERVWGAARYGVRVTDFAFVPVPSQICTGS